MKNNTIKLLESIQMNLNESADEYYLLNRDTGYLLAIEKTSGYYSDDPSEYIAENAQNINEAKRFRKYESAERMADKGKGYGYPPILHYYDNPRESLHLKIVSLNQLINGEVTTKTDLSSIKQNDTKVDDNEDDEEFESNEVEYTFTAEDGKGFTCTVEYEDEPVFEDMPAFIEAVEYSEDKGFNKITSMYGDISIEWIRDEDGEWIGQQS